MERPTVDHEDAAKDGSGIADMFPATTYRGNVNKNGTMDDMACNSMRKGEVKYQMNDADKSEIWDIDIISHYWESNNVNMVVKIAGLYGLRDDTVKAEYVNID